MNITVSKGGRVLGNGISVANTSMTTTIKAGEDLSLQIIPDEGYHLVSLTVGGNDVTNIVLDGMYTVKNVQADINISATFEEIPIALTIQHAENGYLKQFVQRGSNIKFALVPAEGWKINTVVYNGYDVTSELSTNNEYVTPAINADAVLSVSFESTQSAVSSARVSYAKVHTDGVKYRFVFDNVLITSFPNAMTEEETEFAFTINIQKDAQGRFGRAYRILG